MGLREALPSDRRGSDPAETRLLISAPAGFGKTTLVSEWIAGDQRPAAWLSLDDGDSDPTRFLTYLVAAILEVVEAARSGNLLNP